MEKKLEKVRNLVAFCKQIHSGTYIMSMVSRTAPATIIIYTFNDLSQLSIQVTRVSQVKESLIKKLN